MGCWLSSPHGARVYYNSLDNPLGKNTTLRTFGTFRNNSNLIPDDIPGLSSTHEHKYLVSNNQVILYEAEIDTGKGYRCLRPIWLFVLFVPFFWIFIIAYGIGTFVMEMSCDEICCFLRKEYYKRTFFRVYSNRIEVNNPLKRFPWGCMGCGSWNADSIETHAFDRGAFGFRTMNSKTYKTLCCCLPVYGGVVLRQRCPCNGSLWPRMFVDCNGWWCDEWICDMLFCTYKYEGLADAEEVAAACSIALQAYFEDRPMTKQSMDRCLDYWREHISEKAAPVERQRPVCCKPFCVPLCTGTLCHKCIHHERNLPYPDETLATDEMKEVYAEYNEKRLIQIKDYEQFYGRKYNTLCGACGCRRVFGRRGLFFCTEGCSLDMCSKNKCYKKGDPAPPFDYPDFDDDNDASRILQAALGDAPGHICVTRAEKGDEGKINLLTKKGTTKIDKIQLVPMSASLAASYMASMASRGSDTLKSITELWSNTTSNPQANTDEESQTIEMRRLPSIPQGDERDEKSPV